MDIVLQAIPTLETTSMSTLLASLCAVLFGTIAYLYSSFTKEIKEVRAAHLEDLRAKNELSTEQYKILQTILDGINDIKRSDNQG